MLMSQEEPLRRAYAELKALGQSERVAWAKHPVTKAFTKLLEADYVGILESWANGQYTDNDIAGTAQLNAEALGKANAIINTLEWIEDLSSLTDEDMQDE